MFVCERFRSRKYISLIGVIAVSLYAMHVTLLTFFVGISFLVFGITCLTTEYMRMEFVRYGLAKYRKLTGYLQLLGGMGLIFGYFFSLLLLLLSSLGLFILMASGYSVRLKIKDGFKKSAPALFYALLTLYLSYRYWLQLYV